MLHYCFTVLRRMVAIFGCVLAGVVLSAPAWAASFPEKGKPIHFIVGYAAGGGSDVGFRILASGLEKVLGTSVIVENKTGASGQIGLTAVANAKPDGYTIGGMSVLAGVCSYMDPARKATYSRKSFAPLALHVVDPTVVAVRPDSPFKSVNDFIKAAKAAPKTVTITTTGIAGNEHFSALYLEKVTGAQFALVHIAQGTTPAMTAVLGGKIDLLQAGVGEVLAQVKSGDLRILGIMDNQKNPFFPNAPTFEDQGVKLYWASSRGILAPAGTPKEILSILTGAIKKVLDTEEQKKRMADMGLAVRYLDPVGFGQHLDEREAAAAELLPMMRK